MPISCNKTRWHLCGRYPTVYGYARTYDGKVEAHADFERVRGTIAGRDVSVHLWESEYELVVALLSADAADLLEAVELVQLRGEPYTWGIRTDFEAPECPHRGHPLPDGRTEGTACRHDKLLRSLVVPRDHWDADYYGARR